MTRVERRGRPKRRGRWTAPLLISLAGWLAPDVLAQAAIAASNAAASSASAGDTPAELCSVTRALGARDQHRLKRLQRADGERLRHHAPRLALAQACSRWQAGDTSPQAALAVFDALLALARGDDARRWLDTLRDPTRAPLPPLELELASAALHLHNERHAAAAPHAERALALATADRPEHRAARIRALLALAAVLNAGGRPEQLDRAQASLDEAEALLQASGGGRSHRRAELLNRRTLLANARSDFGAVERWARAEWRLLRALDGPDAPSQLDPIASVGAIISSQRRYQETLQVLAEGRRIGRLHPDAGRSAYIGILNNLGPTLVDLGRLDEALAVSHEALAEAARLWGRGSVRTLTPLNRRAAVFESLQRHAEARDDHEELLAILERDGAETRIERRLRLLDNAAGFFMRIGDFDEAARLIQRALEPTADGSGGGYWRGRVLQRAARLAAERSQWQRADGDYRQAYELMRPTYGDGHAYLVGVLAQRCAVQLRAQAPPSACAEVERALPGLEQAGAGERVLARLALARHEAAAGRDTQRLEHLLHALAAAQHADGRGQLWLALEQLSLLLRERGDAALAVLLAKAALAQVEDVRLRLEPQRELQSAYLRDKYELYRRLADWLLEDGRSGEAIDVHQRLRGETLRDFNQGYLPAPSAGVAPGLFNPAEQAWLDASPLALVRDRALVAEARNPAPPTMRSRAQAEARRAAAWRAALAAPTGAARSSTQPARRVAAGELRAWVLLGPSHLGFVVDTPAGRTVLRRPFDATALRREIGRLHDQLRLRADVMPLLRSLHERMAAPIDTLSRAAGARRWRLVLDGELAYLPWAALHDGQGHLVERVDIVQHDTGADRAHGADLARRAVPVRLRAFGASRGGSGMPALPAVADELCAIVDGPVAGAPAAACRPGASGLAGEGWLDEAFTRERLRRAAGDGHEQRLDLLHIGSHFVLDPAKLGRSWLLLGDGSRLALNDLLRWRLHSQDLVTLSACQTAVGSGSELGGLAQTLLDRGAKAVVASLWPVGDRSTGELMRAFYAGVARGEPPSAALRQAQLQLLRSSDARWRHPLHWAGFVAMQGVSGSGEATRELPARPGGPGPANATSPDRTVPTSR